ANARSPLRRPRRPWRPGAAKVPRRVPRRPSPPAAGTGMRRPGAVGSASSVRVHAKAATTVARADPVDAPVPVCPRMTVTELTRCAADTPRASVDPTPRSQHHKSVTAIYRKCHIQVANRTSAQAGAASARLFALALDVLLQGSVLSFLIGEDRLGAGAAGD